MPTIKPDRQWRSSSFQESKKVRVSRDLWPWPWAHPGCRLTCWPSCASLVAMGPFACENKRFSCQHKSARITWPLTLTLTLSKPWMHAYPETIVCKFGRDPVFCLGEEAIFVQRFSCQHKIDHITWPLTLTLTLSTPWMQAYLLTIVFKFGGDRPICLRE